MRHSRSIFLLLFFTLVFMACKKEKVDEPPSILGFWKGKYGNNTNYPSSTISVLFRENGTVRVYDGTDTATGGKAEGTYTAIGYSANTTYTYLSSGLKYSTSAIVNPAFTFIEGTWGSGANTTNAGKFFLVKQ